MSEQQGLVPYSFSGVTDYQRAPQTTLPGQAQGVYISLISTDIRFILNKIVGWFRDRDEVELVDHGISDKRELGYIIVEWYECAVDQLFLAILRDEELVEDYTLYTRDL
jgi:hypothetical protein